MSRPDSVLMRRHIRELCLRHAILAHYNSHQARADKGNREVWLEPITGPLSYLTALHEIGHIVSYRCRTAQWMHEDEPAAWQWAIRNSRILIPWWVYERIGQMLREYGLKP